MHIHNKSFPTETLYDNDTDFIFVGSKIPFDVRIFKGRKTEIPVIMHPFSPEQNWDK